MTMEDIELVEFPIGMNFCIPISPKIELAISSMYNGGVLGIAMSGGVLQIRTIYPMPEEGKFLQKKRGTIRDKPGFLL